VGPTPKEVILYFFSLPWAVFLSLFDLLNHLYIIHTKGDISMANTIPDSQQIKEKRKQYPVCENLRNCHPLIREIKNNVWHENFRCPNLFHPEGIEKKRIMVSNTNRDRALRFLNSLFQYLEARKHEIKMCRQKYQDYDRNDQTPTIIVKGKEVEFILREKSIQYEKRREHDWESKYSYKPTGRLVTGVLTLMNSTMTLDNAIWIADWPGPKGRVDLISSTLNVGSLIDVGNGSLEATLNVTDSIINIPTWG
jgi:hypothetical protein